MAVFVAGDAVQVISSLPYISFMFCCFVMFFRWSIISFGVFPMAMIFRVAFLPAAFSAISILFRSFSISLLALKDYYPIIN